MQAKSLWQAGVSKLPLLINPTLARIHKRGCARETSKDVGACIGTPFHVNQAQACVTCNKRTLPNAYQTFGGM